MKKLMLSLMILSISAFSAGPITKTFKGTNTLTYQSGRDFQTQVDYTAIYNGLERSGPRRSKFMMESILLKFSFGPSEVAVIATGSRQLTKSFRNGDTDITQYSSVLTSKETTDQFGQRLQYRVTFDLDENLMPKFNTFKLEEIAFNTKSDSPYLATVKELKLD